jgi:hypothetical protein
VRAAAQVAALRLAEQGGERGEAFGAALVGHSGGGDGQNGGQQVALAAAGARVGEPVVEALPERAEPGRLVGAARRPGCLMNNSPLNYNDKRF